MRLAIIDGPILRGQVSPGWAQRADIILIPTRPAMGGVMTRTKTRRSLLLGAAKTGLVPLHSGTPHHPRPKKLVGAFG
jgi:hypothetical protein